MACWARYLHRARFDCRRRRRRNLQGTHHAPYIRGWPKEKIRPPYAWHDDLRRATPIGCTKTSRRLLLRETPMVAATTQGAPFKPDVPVGHQLRVPFDNRHRLFRFRHGLRRCNRPHRRSISPRRTVFVCRSCQECTLPKRMVNSVRTFQTENLLDIRLSIGQRSLENVPTSLASQPGLAQVFGHGAYNGRLLPGSSPLP
jgi:hypothetical protein